MTLGIALVLIFVLYLIDKHNRWRQAFKLTVGLVVLGIVGIGGFFGWQKFQAYREAKQEQGQFTVSDIDPPGWTPAEETPPCPPGTERQKDVDLPPGATLVDGPLPCVKSKPSPKSKPSSSPPVKFDMSKAQPIDDDALAKKYGAIPSTPADCEAVVCSEWAMVTAQLGSYIESRECFDTGSFDCRRIAVLKKGDRVQILSEKIRPSSGIDMYEVKFQQWTGWVNASDLSPEKGKEK